MTTFRSAVFAGLLAASCTLPIRAQDKRIEMIPVKYDGLKAEVLKHRGKVVVVDFWAGY
jgi:hypothetical protein